MDTCRRCGTVLPTGEVGGPYCPNCGDLVRGHTPPAEALAAVPGDPHGQGPYGESLYGDAAYGDPGYGDSSTRAYTAVHPGHAETGRAQPGSADQSYANQGYSDQGYTGQGYTGQGYTGQGYADPAYAQAAPPTPPTQPFPAPRQSAVGEEYDSFFRPEPGQASANPRTQVMPPVAEPVAFGSEVPQQYAGYGPPAQPAYDQPIDYQAAPGGPYPEPYAGEYPDQYADAGAGSPHSSRSAKIGIGVAAAAILVIVISLVTLGGGKGSPAAAPGNAPTQDVTAAPAQVPSAAEVSSSPSTSPSTSAAHIPGVLQYGDTGADVKWLQTRLRQIGMYNGPISGKFDQATVTAVTQFQQRAHPADPAGVVGRSTKTALIAWGSRPRLTVGGIGAVGGDKHGKTNPEDVKRLQRALASALNQNVKATGTFDAATFGAVVAYQSSVGLTPDGVVGDRVWAALQSGKLPA